MYNKAPYEFSAQPVCGMIHFLRITAERPAHFNRQIEHTVRQTGEGGEAENRRTQKYEKIYEGKLAERQ
jgi:hypothetical protein